MNLFKCVGDFSEEEQANSTVSFEEFHQICNKFLIKAIESGDWYIWGAEVERNIVSHMYLQFIHKVPRPGIAKSLLRLRYQCLYSTFF